MPAANTSCDPVPVPVVNEVAEEFWKAWSDPDRDFNMADVEDITKTFLSLPTVKAALAALTVADAHRKIIALQAVERDEAQAKLEAERAEVDRLREALFGLLVFARGNPVVLAKIHGALDGRVEDGGELS